MCNICDDCCNLLADFSPIIWLLSSCLHWDYDTRTISELYSSADLSSLCQVNALAPDLLDGPANEAAVLKPFRDNFKMEELLLWLEL